MEGFSDFWSSIVWFRRKKICKCKNNCQYLPGLLSAPVHNLARALKDGQTLLVHLMSIEFFIQRKLNANSLSSLGAHKREKMSEQAKARKRLSVSPMKRTGSQPASQPFEKSLVFSITQLRFHLDNICS